jgi:modification methylase
MSVGIAVAATSIWTFPVDTPARRSYFDPAVFSHPAKLHLGLLQRLIDLYTEPGDTLLDPMAGSGSLMLAATQQRNVILRDLECEYVELMRSSIPIIHRRAGLLSGLIDIDQADARTLECPRFDHVITSPPYGFETSNEPLEARRRRMERGLALGRRWQSYLENPGLATAANGFRYAGGPSNIGNRSGRNYWREMYQVYARLVELLPTGGLMILILKNHYRRGKLIDIVGRTIEVVQEFGVYLVARHRRYIDNPSLWQRRRKEQGLPIVDVEDVLVFGKSRCPTDRCGLSSRPTRSCS